MAHFLPGEARAIQHDNRVSGSAYAFGFVYFTNSTRVAYTTDDEGVPTVHVQVNGGWGEITLAMAEDAMAYLTRKFGKPAKVNNE